MISSIFFYFFIFFISLSSSIKSPSTFSFLSKSNQDPLAIISDVFSIYYSAYGNKFSKGLGRKKINSSLYKIGRKDLIYKSVDGLTHQLKNTFKKSDSLTKRISSYKSPSLKEGTKLITYTNAIEQGMYALELLKLVEPNNSSLKKKALLSLGLEVIPLSKSSNTLTQNGISISYNIFLSNNSYCFNNNEKELIIIVTPSPLENIQSNILSLLKLIKKEQPKEYDIYYSFNQKKPLLSQPTYVALGDKIFNKLNELIAPVANNTRFSLSFNDRENLISSVRVIGYSIGSGPATTLSLLLDGSLKSKIASNSTLNGGFLDRVNGVLIGPPPCLGRTLIPSFIISIINNDDVITRIHKDSVESLQDLVISNNKNGIFKLFGSNAKSSLKSYKNRKRLRKGLHFPGLPFYIKSRRYNEGGTIRQILRGNWQEELLWNIHNIIINKNSLRHHNLDSYIKTLSRC